MNARVVHRAVDEAEASLHTCWDALVALKAAKPADAIARFQHTLGGSLLDLEELYNVVAEERRWLVHRKGRVARPWFLQRQRALGSYQQVIRGTISIGKALGDAFAWFFYRGSPGLLSEHLSKPMHRTFPTGIGGAGEVAMVGNGQLLHGHLLVHHGITSILRIGDVSIVDLVRLEVRAWRDKVQTRGG